MVAMVATVTTYANESRNIIVKDAKRTAITLNVKQGNLLTIKDANGIILYKETMEKEGVYTKGFDLSALPNGAYTVELNKDVQIEIMPFIVNDTEVVFNKDIETTVFKPVTRVKKDLVYVSKLALDEENLLVEIFFEENNTSAKDFNLVFSEKIENTKNLERVYKLSKKGNYKIVYYSQDRVYTEYINN